MRKGLVLALIIVLVFLSFTQRDMVEVWVAYLGTAAASSAGVPKLLSLLRHGSGKPDN